jgi:L-asparaginase
MQSVLSQGGPGIGQPGGQAVLLLGTGGTIAGWAAQPTKPHVYTAAQLGVQALVQAVPALQGQALHSEQIAQIDSKDLEPVLWRRLAQRLSHAQDDPHTVGMVITHGTDTLEETAYLLSRVLTAAKPVVLTAAMRPANASDADGPRNLAQAVALAQLPGACGVLVALHGRAWEGARVRKLHTHAIDAFGTAQQPPVALFRDGAWQAPPKWPVPPLGVGADRLPSGAWPRVEIVSSHAGADGRVVDLLVSDGVQGLVVAGTGNGTIHQRLEVALQRATAAGVAVLRASRVGRGAVSDKAGLAWPAAGELSPAQARVALQLQLLGLA